MTGGVRPARVRGRVRAGPVVAALVLLAVFGWALQLFLGSEAARISDAVDAARDALVAGRDEEFLAFFEPDVTYLDGADMDVLRRDVGRWRQRGIEHLYILPDRKIEVTGDDATVDLVVVLGPGIAQIASADVHIEARKDPDAGWRVRAFTWKLR